MQDKPINKEHFVELAGGDEQAFRRVFHYYTPRLLAFAFSIVKSEAVAEEIVQDVFMKLWINREAIAEKDNPASWLFAVTSNLALTFLRHMSVERRFVDKVKLQMQDVPQHNPVEDHLFLQESEALLKKAMDMLPPRQQLTYQLSRQEGLSHKEIAERLGVSPNTVKNQIVSAIRSISDFIRKASIIFFSLTLVLFI